MNKTELLTQMFLLYWQAPSEPDWTLCDPNSPNYDPTSREYLVLQVYDSLKKKALKKYPWRSAQVYIYIVPGPNTTTDGRYRFSADLSTIAPDFLCATGFWADKTRLTETGNAVDIVGKTAKTNLAKFTMSYTSGTIDESELDPWVIDFLEIFIAAEAADIGGQSADRKNFLIEKAETELIRLGNTDFEMSQKDPISPTITQFDWY